MRYLLPLLCHKKTNNSWVVQPAQTKRQTFFVSEEFTEYYRGKTSAKETSEFPVLSPRITIPGKNSTKDSNVLSVINIEYLTDCFTLGQLPRSSRL